jgi:hypothetical protein
MRAGHIGAAAKRLGLSMFGAPDSSSSSRVFCGLENRGDRLVYKSMLKLVPVTLALLLAVTAQSLAQTPKSVRWSGEHQLSNYDCKSDYADELVIVGTVTIRHPDDNDPTSPSPVISIACDKLTFEGNSILQIASSIDVKVRVRASGTIEVLSIRGIPGQDAIRTPQIWKQTKARRGDDIPGEGPGGGDAADCLNFGGGADPGHEGGHGGRGDDGFKTTPQGANGSPGGNGASVRFIVGEFAPGATIHVVSKGGKGGPGGLGGRGQDGGDGGKGGKGGKGGSGNNCHDPERGGQGGVGGDGGNGANGGRGGDGGAGGNGGNVTVALRDGGAMSSEPPNLVVDGGGGGAPGSGGEPGKGGLHGGGGDGGTGGNGDIFHGGGSGGLAGPPGKDGKDGDPGPDGVPGAHGKAGVIGPSQWGIISLPEFKTLTGT